MYDKLMAYLGGQGMQPGALDRLIQKMEQTRGTKPLYSSAKQTGVRPELQGQQPKPRMYAGI